MRLPWRRRAKAPAASAALPSSRSDTRSWDQVSPLRPSVAIRAPLTTHAADDAAAIGARLRSTSVLVHPPRAARAPRVPDVAGTMMGLATGSPARSTVTSAPSDRFPESTLPTQAQLPAMVPRVVPVQAALDPPGVLVRLDPETATTIAPPRRVPGP